VQDVAGRDGGEEDEQEVQWSVVTDSRCYGDIILRNYGASKKRILEHIRKPRADRD
jgi:hypothetical protein